MNSYLIEVGSNIDVMRKSMGMTQDEFANLLGVSRPTLTKIEQDPTKLTKNVALSLFVALQAEFEANKYRVNQIDPSEFNEVKDTVRFLTLVGSSTPILTKSLFVASLSSLGIPGLASIFLAGFSLAKLSGLIPKKQNRSQKLKDSKDLTFEQVNKEIDLDETKLHWNEDVAEKVLEKAIGSITEKEKECLKYLGLEEWNSRVFVEKIETGNLAATEEA